MKPAVQLVKPRRMSGDTASLNQHQWEALYDNVSDVDTAQAILEMADAMPALVEQHPSLIIQARKTLVFQRNEPARRKVRRSLIGWLGFGIGRLVGGIARGLHHQPAHATTHQKPSFAAPASRGRAVFAVKSGARITSRG